MPRIPASDLKDIFKDGEDFVDVATFAELPNSPSANCYFAKKYVDALQVDSAQIVATMPTDTMPDGVAIKTAVRIATINYKVKSIQRREDGMTDLVLNK